MNKDGLLFRSGTRYLFRHEYTDTLHQGTDDFRIHFLDFNILLDLCEEEINVEPLGFCLGKGLTEDCRPCEKVFLLLLVPPFNVVFARLHLLTET